MLNHEENRMLKEQRTYYRTGNQLVNIFFERINDNNLRTKVMVYSNVCLIKHNKTEVEQRLLMKTTIIPDNVNYFALSDIAYGTYSYKVVQEDMYENVKYETGYIDFEIKEPTYGKGFVTN